MAKENMESRFLDRFRLQRKWVCLPKPTVGAPGLIFGEDRDGTEVVIKKWQRTIDDDGALRELWASEVRQLNTLIASPGARDLIVPMLASGEDKNGFYLVLSPGQRIPLESHLKAPTGGWLQHPRRVQNRAIIWSNAARVARGLSILHNHGILHRNLNTLSIFTDAEDDPDFQLTGFEWSMRLHAGPRSRSAQYSPPFGGAPYSFSDDWKAFGGLICKLFGFDASALVRGNAHAADVLHPSERELLRTLIRGRSADVIDENYVLARIIDIQGIIAGQTELSDTTLKLAVRLDAGSMLTRRIVEASGNTIMVDDRKAQLNFIEADVADAVLYEPKKRLANQRGTLLLQGRHLTYKLKPFRPTTAQPSWDIGYCESADRKPPDPNEMSLKRALRQTPINLKEPTEIRRNWASLSGVSRNWIQLLQDASVAEDLDSNEGLYRAFVLLQALETLFEEAKACPVRVVERETSGSVNVLKVVARMDPSRAELYEALNLDSPAALLRSSLSEDATTTEEDWIIEEEASKGGQEPSYWQFVDVSCDQRGQAIYAFQSPGSLMPLNDDVLLRPNTDMAQVRQARRRMKALAALRHRPELLEVINDPRYFLRGSGDAPLSDDEIASLDEPKKRALKVIWDRLPIVLVQGPPGVGKTRLVCELLRQRYIKHPSSRVLVAAQSHHAVDHVLASYLNDCDSGQDALVIRSRSHNGMFSGSECELPNVAKSIAKEFCRSEMYAQLPAALRDRINVALSGVVSASDPSEIRSMESLILRSANLVFSTTNSADIEHLIDDQSVFDHVVIEEAAKANGLELSSPMMLSHRRLLIGDHEQLPPFDEERIRSVLASPERVSSALAVGSGMLSASFRVAGLQDIVDDLQESAQQDELRDLCESAKSLFGLFERLVVKEYGRDANVSIPVALPLTVQHRMHPDIANLVSDVFYGKAIVTSEEARSRFMSSRPYALVNDMAGLEKSICIIDMPYSQRDMGNDRPEKFPPFSNPSEVDAIITFLDNITLSDGGKSLTIAILAPYRNQVNLIRDKILSARTQGRLNFVEKNDSLSETDNPRIPCIHIGTVDSFQGDEADIVIISMVRNNHHTGLSGVGFMRRPNRMNVLLSRARWKLVIVGSVEFWESRVTERNPAEGSGAFLGRMFDFINSNSGNDGSVGIIKYSDMSV